MTCIHTHTHTHVRTCMHTQTHTCTYTNVEHAQTVASLRIKYLEEDYEDEWKIVSWSLVRYSNQMEIWKEIHNNILAHDHLMEDFIGSLLKEE